MSVLLDVSPKLSLGLEFLKLKKFGNSNPEIKFTFTLESTLFNNSLSTIGYLGFLKVKT